MSLGIGGFQLTDTKLITQQFEDDIVIKDASEKMVIETDNLKEKNFLSTENVSLPQEIIQLIGNFSEVKDFLKFSTVNKLWNQSVQNYRYVSNETVKEFRENFTLAVALDKECLSKLPTSEKGLKRRRDLKMKSEVIFDRVLNENIKFASFILPRLPNYSLDKKRLKAKLERRENICNSLARREVIFNPIDQPPFKKTKTLDIENDSLLSQL